MLQTLLLAAPQKTVRAWKRARYLEPKHLIPALVRYSQKQAALAPEARDQPVRRSVVGSESPSIRDTARPSLARHRTKPLCTWITA